MFRLGYAFELLCKTMQFLDSGKMRNVHDIGAHCGEMSAARRQDHERIVHGEGWPSTDEFHRLVQPEIDPVNRKCSDARSGLDLSIHDGT